MCIAFSLKTSQKTLFVLFLVVIANSYHIHAQKQNNLWYSPVQSLDFNFSPPMEKDQVFFFEFIGTSTIANNRGELLFYAAGNNVFNKNFEFMEGGNNTLLGSRIGQSTLIVPHPGNEQQFYIFTVHNLNLLIPSPFGDSVPPPTAAFYHVVDFTENTLGKVRTKNKQLFLTPVGKITATQTGECHFWVLFHRFQSDEFLAYRITQEGLDTIPVISRVGLEHGPSLFNANGFMKFSPDGSKLAVTIYEDPFDPKKKGTLELFDFDTQTGKVFNPRLLTTPSSNPSEISLLIAFSANSRFLYTEYLGRVYQYDLLEEKPTAFLIFNNNVVGDGQGINDMQLAPDRKIYLSMTRFGNSNNSQGILSTIERPDEKGNASSFLYNALRLRLRPGSISGGVFPNFVESYYQPLADTIRVSPSCNEGREITMETKPLRDGITFQWDFGDPASGNNNQAEGMRVSHAFSSPGQYQVTLRARFCDRESIVKKTVMAYPIPRVALPTDTLLLCENALPFSFGTSRQTLTQYRWENLSDTLPIIRIRAPGWYKLTASNPCGQASDSVFVQVVAPNNPPTRQTRIICDGEEAVLTGSLRAQDYRWDNGQQRRSITVRETGTYIVSIQTPCGIVEEIFDVFVLPEPLPVPPNTFTPNKDGINDTFLYPAIPYPNYRFQVFDRYGQLVYHTNDYQQHWDGTRNGRLVGSGTYFFELRTQNCQGDEVTMKGPILVQHAGSPP
jgi:gliding motility-associated-like protein